MKTSAPTPRDLGPRSVSSKSFGKSRGMNLRKFTECGGALLDGMACACMSWPEVSTTTKLFQDWPTESISAEDTLQGDVSLSETEPMIRRLAEKVWSASRSESRISRTVVLKLKTKEFTILTRNHTPDSPPSSSEELIALAPERERERERIETHPQQLFRLVGVGLSNFHEPQDRISTTLTF